MKVGRYIRKSILLTTITFLISLSALSQTGLDENDRIRLAEAFRLAQKLGNRLWHNWSKTPFAVLLITKENEFLIRHPTPPADFKFIGEDFLLKSKIYIRPRQFPPNLLATFPFEGTPTIVVGQAENTNQKNSTAWVVILLHEHFHQLQMSQSDYNTSVTELDLAGNNSNGSWMLNYAFPYKEVMVGKQFELLSRLIQETMETKNRQDFQTKLKKYLEARADLKKILSSKDYKYFSFQMWQEGIARYTQYQIAELARRKYKPTREFQNLPDYRTFSSIEQQNLQNLKNEISRMNLSDYQRTAFYPLGASEGLLLDRNNRKWRRKYFSEKFYLEELFKR